MPSTEPKVKGKSDAEGWLIAVMLCIVLGVTFLSARSCVSTEVEVRHCRESLTELDAKAIQRIALYQWQKAERGTLLAEITTPAAFETLAKALHQLKTANPVRPAVIETLALVIVMQDGSELELDAMIVQEPQALVRFSRVIRGQPGVDGYLLKFCGNFESTDLYAWVIEQHPASQAK